MRRLRSMFFVFVGCFCGETEMPLDAAPPSSPEQRLAFAKQAARMYRLRLDDRLKQVAKLYPEPLLRWNNQVIREDDGFLFIWTEGEKGRPVAGAQFFLVDRDWNHEFQSLSTNGFDAQCDGEEGGQWSWQPKKGAIDFVKADKIKEPAATAPQRLSQMKSIADRFTAAVDLQGDFASPEQLRLLATPIYRYSANEHSIVDGAIFAFVQGTNPEILLVIEAEGTGSDKAFRYGFARMSSFYLRVQRGDEVVWKKDREPVPTQTKDRHYYFRIQAQPDRSAEFELRARSTLPD